jgi:hypothetical protein
MHLEVVLDPAFSALYTNCFSHFPLLTKLDYLLGQWMPEHLDLAPEAFFSSSSSPQTNWNYDVFLCLRGEDTRKNFTEHLYFALRDAGINVFRDDNDLRRGEDLASEILRAIQRSRISVIIFSTNYAASRWCLEELVEIMECRRTVTQLVLPIFFDVDTTDVRNQTGSFAEAFRKHEEHYLLDIDKVV